MNEYMFQIYNIIANSVDKVHSLEMKFKLLPASKNPLQKYIDR